MNRGSTALLATALLGASGCAADQSLPQARIIADPLSKATKPGTDMIDQARAMLALGNVGLAIEAYRTVLRTQPTSVEALTGLAECYDQMGRYDLSRVKYEMALAVAPKDATVLRRFAASLERQGKPHEGRSLRAEADAAERVELAAVTDQPVGDQPSKVQVPPIPLTEELAEAAARITPGPIVTVELPPASPARRKEPAKQALSSSITMRLPGATGADGQVLGAHETLPIALSPSGLRPHLERMSLAEVALVTASAPHWATQVVHRTALSTTVRFVPLSKSRVETSVRLLNAARHEGLAARTRVALNRKGWSRVTIGDAERVRQRSLILYSAETADQAKRLAAQFRFGIAKDARPGSLTILLGRDAVMSTRSTG